MYTVNQNGKWTRYAGLLSTSLFKTIIYKSVASFWTSQSKKRFYPHIRGAGFPKLADNREYFMSRGETRYIARNLCSYQSRYNLRYEVPFHGYWNASGDYAADFNSLNILGPSADNVLTGFRAREPLDLGRLVQLAIDGLGEFRKATIHTEIWAHACLYRPPCVHPDFRYQGIKTFYACGINIHRTSNTWEDGLGESYIYYPDPHFDMYTCGRNETIRLAPDAWQPRLQDYPESIRDLLVDVLQDRYEKNYPWNYSRIITSEDYRGEKRWHSQLKDAIRFTLFCFLFTHLHLFDHTIESLRSLLFLEPSERMKRKPRQLLLVHKTKEVRVFYDAKEGKKSRVPFLIAVLYPRGGSAYYLCNEAGQRRSGAFLRRPNSLCRRRNAPGVMYEFISIVRHVTGHRRQHKYSGSPVNLVIHWKGGTRSEEPMTHIFQDAPQDVLNYAQEHGLLNQQAWRKVKQLYENVERKRQKAIPKYATYHQLAGPKKRACDSDGEMSEGEIDESVNLSLARFKKTKPTLNVS